jgi:hypothetical protein
MPSRFTVTLDATDTHRRAFITAVTVCEGFCPDSFRLRQYLLLASRMNNCYFSAAPGPFQHSGSPLVLANLAWNHLARP